MARIKRGLTSHKKHKKLLKQAKGYRGSRSKLIKTAQEAVLHAGEYAFHGRKRKKRDFRRLWVTRINEGVKKEGHKYSEFINALKQKEIKIDRKVLSHLATEDSQTFKEIVKQTFDKK